MTPFTAKPINAWEIEARAVKAAAMAGLLSERGTPAEIARLLDQAHRDMVAELAGQRSPSEQTWSVVVGLLAYRERIDAEAKARDYFGASA